MWLWNVAANVALIYLIGWGTWRYAIRPAHEAWQRWLDLRDQESASKPRMWEQIERFRREEGGPGGDRV